MKRFTESDRLDYFVQKVDFDGPNGCWIWTACVDKLGYGVQWDGELGKHQRAHRSVWRYFVGPIPEGLTIDHLCRNRACVNPDHLEPVTLKVNVLRGNNPAAINARKTHCFRGHTYDSWQHRGRHRSCTACRSIRDHQRRFHHNTGETCPRCEAWPKEAPG